MEHTDSARRGLMLMLSSPSGAGKTTLSRRLLKEQTDLCFSVSVTTRPKRPREVDGEDYHFIDEAQFQQMCESGALLEQAEIYGHHYGTPAEVVLSHLAEGRDVLFEIDWHGYRQLAAKCPEDVVGVFILPPSLEELQRRLKQRAQDSEEAIAKRQQQVAEEISHWQDYDYVIVNQDLDAAHAQLVHILKAERLKRARQTQLAQFVKTLV